MATRLSKAELDELAAGLPGMTLAERRDTLRLLCLHDELDAETFEDPRNPMADYLMEFGGAVPVARPVSWPAGEPPDLATYIASFTPAMPATPPKADAKPVIADTPDIATRVPLQRRPRLLQDVIERTQQEEARRQMERLPDEDRLGMYRGVGRLDLDGSEYTDE